MKSVTAAFALALSLSFAGASAHASPNGKLQVVVFAAPWCAQCTTDLPRLQTALDALTEVQDQFTVRGYVCSGATASARPSQELADRYRAELKLSFPMIPDVWKWQTYKKLFGSDYELPAAVVLNENGEALERFRGADFRPEAIAKFVEENTDGGR